LHSVKACPVKTSTFPLGASARYNNVMRLSAHLALGTFGLLVACSFRGPASTNREPASAPIGPERSRKISGDTAPVGPERNRNIAGHAGSGIVDARTPSSKENPDEIRAGCGSASLLRIDMGEGYSAHDVLTRLQSDGTFSGRVRIPTWRNVGSDRAPAWIVDYASAVEFDRRTLAKWFDGADPSVVGSDLYEAVRDSEPFNVAAQFVNSNSVVRVYRGQYDLGHRMASLLAVMFATAKQGDPDCVDYINREWVSKILPDAEAEKLLKQVRSKEAAQLVKEGRLDKTFAEVAGNRKRIHDDLKNMDEQIKRKEEQNVSELEQIHSQLKQSYFSLKSELMEITPCRDFVSLQETLTVSSSDPKVFANQMVADCKTRISSKLDSARTDVLRLQGDIKLNESRRKNAEDALKNAEERGRSGEVDRRQEAIARYDEKIEQMRNKLETVSKSSQMYADYLAYLTNAESGSVSMELKRINDLLADRQKRVTTDYLKPEMQQVERLKGDLKANSTNYLTLGFFGGFDGSDPAGAFSR